jgi:hypothetical protein
MQHVVRCKRFPVALTYHSPVLPLVVQYSGQGHILPTPPSHSTHTGHGHIDIDIDPATHCSAPA